MSSHRDEAVALLRSSWCEVEWSGVNREARPSRATGKGCQAEPEYLSLTSELQMSFQPRLPSALGWVAAA